MGFIYVLTDDDKPSKIKVGKSTCTREQLLGQYLRAAPRAKIQLWLECNDESAIECKIKEHFLDKRQINVNGKTSEWIEGVTVSVVIKYVEDLVQSALKAACEENEIAMKILDDLMKGGAAEPETPLVPPVAEVPKISPANEKVVKQLTQFALTEPSTFETLCNMNIGVKNMVLLVDYPYTREFVLSSRVQRTYSNIDEAAAFVGAGNENIIYLSNVELYCVVDVDDIIRSYRINMLKNVREYRPIIHFTKVSKGFGFYCVCIDKRDVNDVRLLARQFFATNTRAAGDQVITFVRVASDADYMAKLSKFATFVRQRLGRNDTCIRAPVTRSIQNETYYEFVLSPADGLSLNPSSSRNPTAEIGEHDSMVKNILTNPPKDGDECIDYVYEVDGTFMCNVVVAELGYLPDATGNGPVRWYKSKQTHMS